MRNAHFRAAVFHYSPCTLEWQSKKNFKKTINKKKNICWSKASVLHSSELVLSFRNLEAFHSQAFLSKSPFTPPRAKEVLHAAKFCWLEYTHRRIPGWTTTPITAFICLQLIRRWKNFIHIIVDCSWSFYTSDKLYRLYSARDHDDPCCKAPPCMPSKFLYFSILPLLFWSN